MRKHPKPALRDAGGALYRHPAGFVLRPPQHLTRPNYAGADRTTLVTLGRVTLLAHHRTRTLSGDVPASWLIDLNADSACTREEVEA